MKAIMFPGQGLQHKGMGKNLFSSFKKEVAEASTILGYDIEELCLEDPRRELGKTQFTQPAVYVVSAFTYMQKQRRRYTQLPERSLEKKKGRQC